MASNFSIILKLEYDFLGLKWASMKFVNILYRIMMLMTQK